MQVLLINILYGFKSFKFIYALRKRACWQWHITAWGNSGNSYFKPQKSRNMPSANGTQPAPVYHRGSSLKPYTKGNQSHTREERSDAGGSSCRSTQSSRLDSRAHAGPFHLEISSTSHFWHRLHTWIKTMWWWNQWRQRYIENWADHEML